MKIAIVGLGVIGKTHVKALAELGREVSLLCDILPQRAEQVRESLAPGTVVYTDFLEMLEKEKPDAVHICTPHFLHAQMIVEALRRDIHVLCEKPLCMKKEELDAVLAAEKESRAKLGVCHQNRYNEVNLFVKEYLADKTVQTAHGAVTWRRDKSYYESEPWRGTLAYEGGGVLINQALHTLDLMGWFFGEPQTVAASCANLSLQGEVEVEDTVCALFDGKTGYSFFATVGCSGDLSVEINFKIKGGAQVTVLPHAVYANGSVIFSAPTTAGHGKACYGNGHSKLIDDFYSCLAQNRPFALCGAECAKVMRMIWAVYESKGEKTQI